MSWQSYVRDLLPDRPVFALDATGRIRIWSVSMQLLTGVAAGAALGKPWEDFGTVAGRKWLAASNGARTGELALKHRAGTIRVAVVAWPVSSRAHRVDGVMCSVDSVVSRGTAAPTSHCYEITTDEGSGGFGHLIRHHGSSPQAIGKRCYQVIAGHAAPCPGCPVKDLPIDASQTSVVRARGGHLVVARARRASAQTASVSAVRIDPEVMTRLVHARLDHLAGEHGLSHREREVLVHLASGASTEDIAAALDITPRTIKFHAANVLTKLGLASRLELVRLIFDVGTGGAAAAASNGDGHEGDRTREHSRELGRVRRQRPDRTSRAR